MENNNGRGIFYGVIGVATLVVAIIGATFAYFAASTSGNEAVNATSANISGTLSIAEVTTGLKSNMIPTTQAIMIDSYNQSGSGAQAKCAGVSKSDGTTVFDLCSVYTFTLTNSADVAQTVYVSLAPVKNEFSNLNYCLFDGASTTVMDSSCKAISGITEQKNIITVTIPAGDSHTYHVSMFVNEINDDQTDLDSGKSFIAKVTASTSDGNNNVTGILAS